MRSLVVAVLSMGVALPGQAETSLITKVGAWQAFGGKTTGGRPVCGVSQSAGDRYFGLKFYAGDSTFTVQLGAKSWRLENGAKQKLQMVLDGNRPWMATGTGMTLSAASSTILITNTSATSKTMTFFAGAALGAVTLSGGTGTINVGSSSNAASFTTFTITAPATSIVFNALATYTFTSFVATGSSGNTITIASSSASRTSLSKSSGVVNCDWLVITNLKAIGGASWYAGSNSTNGGGNFGWQFSNQDSSKANFFQVI